MDAKAPLPLLLTAAALACSGLMARPAEALDEIIIKRAVRIPNFAFVSGEVIPELRLGYETYGRMNAAGDNVILIAHYFLGDSHAAGRYPGATEKGYWDEIIGPGRAIDTDRYFVVSTDLPIGMMVKRPTVITTGPRSIDPRTGQPYGLSFPEVTVRDMVRAQRLILQSLGVRRLAAVTGPSMGGMISWQWAIDYPGFAKRIIPISAPLTFSSLERQGYRAAELAIMSDPTWALGNYQRYGLEPDFGVALAARGLLELSTGTLPRFYFSLRTHLAEARTLDANTYLRTLQMHRAYDITRAYGSFGAALARVRASIHVIGFQDDDFIKPSALKEIAAVLNRAGLAAELTLLPGGSAHFSSIEEVPQLDGPIRRALATP